MKVSVIIPTRNRIRVLERTLNALDMQSYPQDKYEVVIVDDGSTDDTSTQVLHSIARFRMRVTFLQQPLRGPAAARNLALRNADGEIVLFINDDIVPTSNLINEHAKSHKIEQNTGAAVLGRVTWSPEIEITPFMYWLEHGGPQFKYDQLKPGEISWRYFWTCNLSLKRHFLLQKGIFDEDFPFASWEDAELGYRLGKAGLRLFYNEAAVAYHYHPITLESAKEKMLIHGRSAVIMDRKVPCEAKPSSLKSPHKQIIRILDTVFLCKPSVFILWRLAKWAEHRINLKFLFNIVTLHYRIEGQRNAELALGMGAKRK